MNSSNLDAEACALVERAKTLSDDEASGLYTQAISAWMELFSRGVAFSTIRYAEAFFERGRIRDREGQIQYAISDYTEAVGILARLSEADLSYAAFLGKALLTRGMVYDEAGNFAQAFNDYSYAIELFEELEKRELPYERKMLDSARSCREELSAVIGGI